MATEVPIFVIIGPRTATIWVDKSCTSFEDFLQEVQVRSIDGIDFENTTIAYRLNNNWIEFNKTAFATTCDSNWSLVKTHFQNKRANPFQLHKKAVNVPLRQFRGVLCNHLRVLAKDIKRDAYDRLNENEKALLRRTLYLSQFGIIAFECPMLLMTGADTSVVEQLRLRLENFKNILLGTRYWELHYLPLAREQKQVVGLTEDIRLLFDKNLQPQNLIQALRPQSLTTTTYENIYYQSIYWNIWKRALSFHCTSFSAPELQVVSLFWCPIFELAYVDPIREMVASTTEFYLDVGKSKLRADYAGIFTSSLHKGKPPLFFVEAAADKTEREMRVGGFFHNDYSKLAWMMARAFLYYAGLFRDVPEILSQLKVYGAFVAGTQIQFAVLYETIPQKSIGMNSDLQHENQSSMVFQTSGGHWRVNFGDNTGNRLCATGCRHIPTICTSEPGKFTHQDLRIPPLPEAGAQFEDIDDDDRAILDELMVEPSRETLPAWNISSDPASVSEAVKCVIEFFREVTVCTRTVVDMLVKKETLLREPLEFPEELDELKPTSASAHSRSSPAKSKETPQKKAGNSYLNKKIKKPSVMHEIQTLLSLQEYESPFIVKLCGYYVSGDSYFLEVEPLIDTPLDMKSDLVTYFDYGMQMLMCVLNALELLDSLNLVHRDVAPQNIMYSTKDQCWKLIDFETCATVDPNTRVYEDLESESWVGTPKFVAPESEKYRVYSHKSDVFGLSWCYEEMFSNIVGHSEVFQDYDLFQFSLAVDSIVSKNLAKNPEQRLTATETSQKLSQIYSKLREVYY